MKQDYPEANARLAEVAKSWAEGEVSHDVWRKERHSIISTVWSKKRDWENKQNHTLPLNKQANTSPSLTMPNVVVPPQLLGTNAASLYQTADTEVSNDEVLLLALLLLSMVFTAVILLYWV
ncbi:MAG: hypothetical protein KBF23_02505 [Agitococcus sp.]|jgi:hypothetical protein|nr:hypothetical protein [Moraxellaceae bacterium]MBP9216020.1 hypothetical protein [Agitococcus sp.]MBK8326149.1 hypothetical protein [Moraxellaceae bacterium]MBK9186148.1 hypothetical protein [Moraxellaceae bacterium]MBL0231919.1 hypothetical protein [Moraxellaceae bacterium]